MLIFLLVIMFQHDGGFHNVLLVHGTYVNTSILQDRKQKNTILSMNNVKGTHTIYFGSSLYIINQNPMIHRSDFHFITTWVARTSG